jgi:hypothetical protein
MTKERTVVGEIGFIANRFAHNNKLRTGHFYPEQVRCRTVLFTEEGALPQRVEKAKRLRWYRCTLSQLRSHSDANTHLLWDISL